MATMSAMIECGVFLGYVLSLFLISHVKDNSTSLRAYVIGKGNTGLFAMVATLVMTEMNTGTFLAFASMGYLSGLWGLTFPAIFLVGLLFYGMVVARFWKSSGFFTIAHYFQSRYSQRLGDVARYFFLVALIGFAATYIKALSLVFMPLFPSISMPWISFMLTLLIVLLTLRGGLLAVIRSDIFSFTTLLLLLPMYLFTSGAFSLAKEVADPDRMPIFQPVSLSYIFSLTILTMFSYILAPWYSQKLITAKSATVAKQASLLAAVIIFLFYSAGVWICYAIKRHGLMLVNHELALPTFLNQGGLPGLQGLGFGLLFVLGATTLTGLWNAQVSLCMTKERLQAAKQLGMLLTMAFALLAWFVANMMPNSVLQNMILVNIPIVAMSFCLLAGIYWRRTSVIGAWASMMVGVVGAIFCYWWYGEEGMYTWYWACMVIPALFSAGLLASLLFPDQAPRYAMLTSEIREKNA